MLQRNIPEPVKVGLTTENPLPGCRDDANHSTRPQPRSYLHKILASTIVHLFILLRFIIPYAKVLLRQLYEHERARHITERIVDTSLEAADMVEKGSANIGAAVCKFNEGRFSLAFTNFAAWWIESVAGGIYEGVREGMEILGILGIQADLDRLRFPPTNM